MYGVFEILVNIYSWRSYSEILENHKKSISMSESSTVRGSHWMDWLFIWNRKKDYGKGQGDNNNGSTLDASTADESAKEFIKPEIPAVDNSTLETTNTGNCVTFTILFGG